MIIHETDPLNAETPLAALAEPLTPNAQFYVRSHASTPRVDRNEWRLAVGGEVDRPLRLAWDDLRAMPARHVPSTLECAGNGRALMPRETEGTAWGLGAAGTASFTGVPLVDLLRVAGVRREVQEILFAGADVGPVAPGRTERYLRSLHLADALGKEVLLAWAMNGEDLAPEHGYPLRLIAPGWYGMASVKWLETITALARPFEGYYQTERYVYKDEDGAAERTPVTRIRVRSVIARPGEGERLPLALTEIAGTAWSGRGPVVRVEVSANEGSSWAAAELGQPASSGAAIPWRHAWQPPEAGSYTLVVRATDAAGNVQPLEPLWNRYGYGNNVAQRVRILIA